MIDTLPQSITPGEFLAHIGMFDICRRVVPGNPPVEPVHIPAVVPGKPVAVVPVPDSRPEEEEQAASGILGAQADIAAA